MTEKEKDKKIKDIVEEWKKEADKISIDQQSNKEAMLDNGSSGKFNRLTEKYQKIINEIKNS